MHVVSLGFGICIRALCNKIQAAFPTSGNLCERKKKKRKISKCLQSPMNVGY